MNIAASTQLTVEPKMERFKKEPRIKAGGQGSGRKPAFGNAKNLGKLNDMHNNLTKIGFKYSGSYNDSPGVTGHRYEGNKKLSYSDGTQQTAFIKQHDDGHHTSEIY